jgi:histone H3/H4
MAHLIVKNNIKKAVVELDKEGIITSVADEVGTALSQKVEEILRDAIRRAKLNNRRTLLARDI